MIMQMLRSLNRAPLQLCRMRECWEYMKFNFASSERISPCSSSVPVVYPVRTVDAILSWTLGRLPIGQSLDGCWTTTGVGAILRSITTFTGGTPEYLCVESLNEWLGRASISFSSYILFFSTSQRVLACRRQPQRACLHVVRFGAFGEMQQRNWSDSDEVNASEELYLFLGSA